MCRRSGSLSTAGAPCSATALCEDRTSSATGPRCAPDRQKLAGRSCGGNVLATVHTTEIAQPAVVGRLRAGISSGFGWRGGTRDATLTIDVEILFFAFYGREGELSDSVTVGTKWLAERGRQDGLTLEAFLGPNTSVIYRGWFRYCRDTRGRLLTCLVVSTVRFAELFSCSERSFLVCSIPKFRSTTVCT